MRFQSILAAALTATALSGCASMFGIGSSSPSCPGGQGIGCVSAREAYSMSNNPAAVEAAEAKGSGKDVRQGLLDPQPVSAIQVSLPEPVQQSMPVMEPAKIMRLWINTWQDDQQQLHFPSIVFIEVTPRRWSIGNNSNTSQAKTLVPYRIDPSPNTGAVLVTSGPGGSRPTPARPVARAQSQSQLPTTNTSN